MEALTPDEYARRYQARHDSIFRGGPVENGPFANMDWRMVLLTGGLYVEEDVFSALAAAARQHEDDVTVAVDRDSRFPEQPPVLLPWDAGAWHEARTGTVLGHVDVNLFGPSGTWGMVASPEDFAVLAGNASFLAAFQSVLPGGRQLLRDRFAEAMRAGTIGFGEQGRRYAEKLVSIVGWA